MTKSERREKIRKNNNKMRMANKAIKRTMNNLEYRRKKNEGV